jgi:hypothetical protein
MINLWREDVKWELVPLAWSNERLFLSIYYKNIFVVKNRSRVLPHSGDTPGEQGMAE